MDARLTVRVQCEPGHRDEETPRAFFVGDRRVDVVEVLDWWPGQDHRYFKVWGSDGDLYILRANGHGLVPESP